MTFFQHHRIDVKVVFKFQMMDKGLKFLVHFVFIFAPYSLGISIEQFLQDRELILEEEGEMFLGANLDLTAMELFANHHLMTAKKEELDNFFRRGGDFPPAQSFFQSKRNIERSPVYEFIQDMPKGLLIHTHLVSAGSLNFTVRNLTYRDGLYIKFESQSRNLFFKWFAESPSNYDWFSLKELR